MKREKIIKKLSWFMLLLFSFLVFLPQTVNAISSKEEKIITPSNLKEWDDGASVTKETSGKGENYQVEITADTTGLKEDYYSIYIYDDTKRNVGPYDGIRFQYLNQSDIDLRMNVTIKIDAKTSVTTLDKSYAILEEEEKENAQVITAKYGTLLIPAGFSGTIYVPFSQLFNEKGERVLLNNIQSFGITTVMENEQTATYSIGNFAFLSGSIDAMKDSHYLITLTGEEEVVVPSTGAVIEKYEASVVDLEGNEMDTDVTFFLEDAIEGITLSENGALEIQSDCVATKITIYAKTKQSINAGKMTLSLKRVSAKVAAVGVPKAQDVPSIATSSYQSLKDSILLLRLLALMIVFLIGAVITTWFNQAKMHHQMIQKKLYQIFQDQEEEESP